MKTTYDSYENLQQRWSIDTLIIIYYYIYIYFAVFPPSCSPHIYYGGCVAMRNVKCETTDGKRNK